MLKNQSTVPDKVTKRNINNNNFSAISALNNNNNNNNNFYIQTTSSNNDKTPTVRDTYASNKSKSLNIDIFYKYVSDLKSKFKIVEDASSIKNWEGYYNELMLKINSYRSQYKNNLEATVYFIYNIARIL